MSPSRSTTSRSATLVRTTLDGLSADGVLEAIRTKWVGEFPKLKLAESLDASASAEASATTLADGRFCIA